MGGRSPKSGRGKRGAAATAARQAGGEAAEASGAPLDFQDDEAAIDAWTRDAFAGQDMNWTAEQLKILADWQGDENYSVINEKLWKGKPLTAPEKKMVAALDRVASRGRAPRDMVVYRGIDEWQTVVGSATIGSTFSKKNFASMSLSRVVAENFIYRTQGAVLKVRLPAGSKGVWMGGRVSREGRDPASFTGEREFLLPRGSKFRVTDYSRTSLGTLMIHVDLVGKKGRK